MKTVSGILLSLCMVTLTAQAGVNPTISVNTSTTTKLVKLSNKTASGVLNDPTDPLKVYGIDFTITDESPGTVILSCTSNTVSVVPNDAAHLIISGSGTSRNVKIIPASVGYASITIRVKDNENKTASYVLKYAASAAADSPSANQFHTFLSSASTAIPWGGEYMFIGDDEINDLSLYHRNKSGAPVYVFNVDDLLDLPDPGSPEVDIEASCISPSNPSKIYWLGSMSNSNAGELKPNRDRIFATTLSGSGEAVTVSMVGYAELKEAIILWGDARGYNFTSSTADGKDPKSISGFSAEGMEFAPDNTTLYIGFRTPVVPTTNRTKALICPVLNFETWFNNGSPNGNPSFGNPIELNLGGRGIRSIGKNTNNEYLIVAGAHDETNNFALFQWSGNAADAPVLLSASLNGLSPEGFVEVPSPLINGSSIELVNDYGTMDWYDDGKESKDLSSFEFQKFSSTHVTLNGLLTFLNYPKPAAAQHHWEVYPNPCGDFLELTFKASSVEQLEVSIYNSLGIKVDSYDHYSSAGDNTIRMDCSTLTPGAYLITVSGNNFPSKKFIKR